jgi:NAD(P)-dependent dehydrogenase (short-subunit alcohol dehydrogenase family)
LTSVNPFIADALDGVLTLSAGPAHRKKGRRQGGGNSEHWIQPAQARMNVQTSLVRVEPGETSASPPQDSAFQSLSPSPHTKPADAVVQEIGSDAARGLNRAEAKRRLERFGPNELKRAPETPWWKRLLGHDVFPDGYLQAYGAFKAALTNYVAEIARTLGPKGIRANTVTPGQIYFPGGV